MAAIAPQDIQQAPVVQHPLTNGAVTETSHGHASLSKIPTENTSALPLHSAPNVTIDGSSNPVKTPFVHPAPVAAAAPPRVLNPDQETKYTALLATAQSWTALPTTSATSAPKSPLTDTERIWLTRECLLRYLRASKWNLANATTRLEATLVWRREYGIKDHTADYISPENTTGKQIIVGYDNGCRPCLYLNPQKQNTEKSDRQIHHLIYMLERCIDLMPPGTETLAMLVNFKETRKGQGASVAQGRQVISILQSHYPERLGRACMKDLPWIIWGFFKMITPFIDPLTKEKMKFDVDLRQVVPSEQLLKSYGGDCEFEYDHNAYWPALNEFAGEKRAAMMKRWEAAGRRIGESESYLKGAGEPVGPPGV